MNSTIKINLLQELKYKKNYFSTNKPCISISIYKKSIDKLTNFKDHLFGIYNF